MSDEFDLTRIRVGTPQDLTDAQDLVKKLLATASGGLDRVSKQFCQDFLTALALKLAYDNKAGNLIDVLDYFDDPRWELDVQKLQGVGHGLGAYPPSTARWVERFLVSKSTLDNDGKEILLKRCRLHLDTVGTIPRKRAAKGVKTRGSLPVFNQDALAKAIVKVRELKEGVRATGERLLQAAHANEGCRTLPDAKRAILKLEAAKAQFENLVEPLGRLQLDLVLAAAMKPQAFRISPILLLGDPGIGKTYLATQLAEALGVATDKISAGGAQGGFQFTGSHRSWNNAAPGALFTLLAEGDSASPVVVIDEVDKIRDAQYPVLPVLLDVLDAETAVIFKDEFFEMGFDVSRVIFVLTANTLKGIPDSLLSRVDVFDVPAPLPAQRLRIIEETAEKLRLKTGRAIALHEGTRTQLAERMDIDLRRVTRLVKEAFARAMQIGATVAYIEVPTRSGKRSIGFHSAWAGEARH